MEETNVVSASQGDQKCSKCGRTFKTLKGLNIHLRACKVNSHLPIPNWPTTTANNDEFRSKVVQAYDQIVFWKKDFFELPKCSHGKDFIREMTRLVSAWSSKSSDRDICLKALMVMPSLLLLRTSKNAKTAENKQHLARRLALWKERKIEELLREGMAIQSRRNSFHKDQNKEELSRKFSRLMMEGKLNAAIRLLDENSCGILPLDEDTMQCLLRKHPSAQPKYDAMLLQGPIKDINNVIYDDINAELIRKCALKTKGASGPSGMDADFWRKIIGGNVFGSAADDLCHAIALMTRQLCTDIMEDPHSLSPIVSCRLIPLDKRPGLRPIGIGEVLRRIMGKSVMAILKRDVIESAGYEQLCAGIEAGCEVAIHVVREMFSQDDTHGFIQVDASNAFNNINRSVLLHNTKITCPEISTYMANFYHLPARLFVLGGQEIASEEGTTQGDPIAMSMYALGLIPLLSSVMSSFDSHQIKQIAFADDLTGMGKLEHLKTWWDLIKKYGHYIGYEVNDQKSMLIVKDEYFNKAKELFSDSEIFITSDGNRHLGAVIGNHDCSEKYTNDKVNSWVKQLDSLIAVARTQPHAAYSAFMHCLRHRYVFVMRTVPNISVLLKKLDRKIDEFIRVILNDYQFNDSERLLYSLPARYGGLGVIIPSQMADREYERSLTITSHTKECMLQNIAVYDHRAEHVVAALKTRIKREKNENYQHQLNEIKEQITDLEKNKALEASLENGSSIWLTAIPLKEHGFALDKQSFWDALRLRYAIPLERLPTTCVCSAPFNVQHALSCPRGGFIINRHNELRNCTAEIVKEVCQEVIVEPLLQPLTGEIFKLRTAITTNEARTDVAARSFWVKGQMAYADVRVFNPLAKCHKNLTLQVAHKKNENEKKRSYNERIIHVDHGSFTPLVFSCFGGMSRECSRFYSHAADLIAEKRKLSKSIVSAWIKTRLNFSLIRSMLLCVRGTRSMYEKTHNLDGDIELAVQESRIQRR